MKVVIIEGSHGAIEGLSTHTEGIRVLQRVERYGRVSHRSEERMTEDSWKSFIPKVVVGHGDWSITEHVSLTALITTTRSIANELVRHRLGAITQESTRFVNYNKEEELRLIVPQESGELYQQYISAVGNYCGGLYEGMLGNGYAPQEAREVLPLCTATTLYLTYNLRMWRHIMLMRTTKESHPMMRELTIPMLRQLRLIPFLFDDIVPDARQSHNLKLGR